MSGATCSTAMFFIHTAQTHVISTSELHTLKETFLQRKSIELVQYEYEKIAVEQVALGSLCY